MNCRGCQEMRLPALLLVAILTFSCDAAADHQDIDCEDCHENGHWFPLFHPSQIISSEFPEHEQYRSHDPPPPLTYATARPQVSREVQSHGSVEAVPQDLEYNYQDHQYHSHELPSLTYTSRSQVSRESQEDLVPPPVPQVDLHEHYRSHEASPAVHSGPQISRESQEEDLVPPPPPQVELGLEHYRSHEAPPPAPPVVHATSPQISRESQSQEGETFQGVPQVPRTVPQMVHQAGPQKETIYQDLERHSHEELQLPPTRPQMSHESHSHEGKEGVPRIDLTQQHAGVDSSLNSYNDNGQHRVEWDHYGDVTTVATVAYNSLEDREGGAPRASGEDRSDRENLHSREPPEQDTSVKSQEAFFDNGSFFDKQSDSEDISTDFLFAGEHHHHSNSIEDFNSLEHFGGKPIATSYASISSVFESRPVPRARDLLHPHLAFNDIPHYIDLPRLRSNTTRKRQYLVHEPQSREDPGVLHVSHPESSPRNRPRPTGPLGPRPSSFVPLDHPVYRYVKVHGGMNRKSPQSQIARLDDIHPRLRSKFPFKYLRPRVAVQNHQTFVRHVIPTKDPFSDSFFKESQKIEKLQPPPLEHLYYYKKKPSPVEMKNIARIRHSPGYMYIIRRNRNR